MPDTLPRADWSWPVRLTMPLWRRLLRFLVRARSVPQPLSELGIDPAKPVLYVLEAHGLASYLILEMTCRDEGLPLPGAPLGADKIVLPRSYGAVKRYRGIFLQRLQARRASRTVRYLLAAHAKDPTLDAQIVPVSVLIGRAPDKESRLTKVLFSENWELGGRLRRLLSLIVNGRATFVHFGTPLVVSELTAQGFSGEQLLRRVMRSLRTTFRRTRTAAIGPDRSHRRTLIERLLKADSVQEAIAAQAKRDQISRDEAEEQARRFAWEIAADYSFTFVRAMEILLTWFWNKIYRGVEVHHFNLFQRAAPGHEVIYVPCHRSHIDYLVLSYILYQRGFVPPHVAAGVNLNMPFVGPLLRRGGAFFLRRSFRSQPLYAAVFSEYTALLLNKGVHIEFFPEGTRSRTGRLLPPRAGLLAITVRGHLQAPRRPLLYQPVNIGYERLVEGGAYTRELYGQSKKKETVWDLLSTVFGIIRRNHGQVHVSFSEPILLDEMLERRDPEWRDSAAAGRPAWLPAVVDELANRIATGINQATHANPVSLLAAALLATRLRAMDEVVLCDVLAKYQKLLSLFAYAPRITVSAIEPAGIIAYGLDLEIIERLEHPLGAIIRIPPRVTSQLTYYRNNIAHLLALPSLIASCFMNAAEIRTNRLRELVTAIYPFLKNELYLPWLVEDLPAVLDHYIQAMIDNGLLYRSDDQAMLMRATGGSDSAFYLRNMARTLIQTLERYYITFAILDKNGSGTLSRAELEKLGAQTAERIGLLLEYETPEFADQTLFRQFIDILTRRGIISRDDEGRLIFDQRLTQFAVDAKLILGKELRHSILHITPTLGPKPPAGGAAQATGPEAAAPNPPAPAGANPPPAASSQASRSGINRLSQ